MESARTLLRAVRASHLYEHMRDVYGPGIVYYAAGNESPVYHSGERTHMCGETACGALATRPNTLVLVVDVPATRRRYTLIDGGDEFEQTLDLVAVDVVIEEPPPVPPVTEALLDVMRAQARAAPPTPTIVYVDARTRELAPAMIAVDDFLHHLEELYERIPEPTTESLERVATLATSHESASHVVGWARLSDDYDWIDLVARR